MKLFNFKLLVVIGLTFFAANASFARDLKTIGEGEAHSSERGNFGLGYSSTVFTGGASSNGSAATALFKLNSHHWIQAYLTVPGTSPFEILGGADYKYTIADSQNAGFHIGGGALLGSVSRDFALYISGLAGLHFHFSDIPHVLLQFDGGPRFSVVNSNSNFGVQSSSLLLGLSVLYVF